MQVPGPPLKMGCTHQQQSWDPVARVSCVTRDGCPMGPVSLQNQQTFLVASAHRGSPTPAPGSTGGSAGTAGTDPGALLALGLSFLSATRGTRGSPPPGLTGRAELGPRGAAGLSTRGKQDPAPPGGAGTDRASCCGRAAPCRGSARGGAHLLHPSGEEGDGWRLAGPSLYQKLPNIQLSYKSRIAFLFLVFTKGAEHGLGGRRGSLCQRGRLSCGCHLCARPRPLLAGRGIAGVIQPGRDARGLFPP